MLSVIRLSVVRLNVVRLNVFNLSVVAPIKDLSSKNKSGSLWNSLGLDDFSIKVEKKIAQLFEKGAKTVAQTKKCSIINAKAQFKSPKPCLLNHFWNIKMPNKKQCFEIAYLGKNVSKCLKRSPKCHNFWGDSSYPQKLPNWSNSTILVTSKVERNLLHKNSRYSDSG